MCMYGGGWAGGCLYGYVCMCVYVYKRAQRSTKQAFDAVLVSKIHLRAM